MNRSPVSAIVLCTALFYVSVFGIKYADARSPAKPVCYLDSKAKKHAVKSAQKVFPGIKKVDGSVDCSCMDMDECALAEVSFKTFAVSDKTAKISANVSVRMTVEVRDRKDRDTVVLDDGPAGRVELDEVLKRIRKLPQHRSAFGNAPIVCDVSFKAYASSVQDATFECRPTDGGDTRTLVKLGSGPKKTLSVTRVTLPLEGVRSSEDFPMWAKALRRRAVKKFVKTYPDSNLTIDGDTIYVVHSSGNSYMLTYRGMNVSEVYRVPATLVDDYFDGWIDVAARARPVIEELGEANVTVVRTAGRVELETPDGTRTKFDVP